MTKSVRKYFACANSCKGFVNFFPSILNEMDKIYILKGGPGTGKSTMMKKIGEYFLSKNERIEYIYCSSDTDSLDGVVLRDRKTAVVDGTAPHVIEPKAPGAIEEYVNLGVAWNSDELAEHKEEILTINSQISQRYDSIYKLLGENKKIHDRWERLYIDNVDFKALDKAADDLVSAILKDAVPSENAGEAVHCFLEAMTPEGSVNYIENLTADLTTRYFVKGNHGVGKSTMLKKVAAMAQAARVRAEIYHCGFDADILDMIVLPELSICVFNSAASNEISPSKESDIIFDLSDISSINPNTDGNNAETLSIIIREYNDRMDRVRSILGEIHTLHDCLEKYYIRSVDFGIIDSLTNQLISEIDDRRVK